jgi:hypothetical protein
MRLAPGQQIAGFPATKIRDLLRRFSPEGGRPPCVIAARLKVSEARAVQLADELVRLGLLSHFFDTSEAFTLTPDGARLAQARAGAPLTRATASRRLSELIDRIPEANANETFAYVVERALVFGSFLSDVPTLGDVDVDLTLAPRSADRDEAEAARERSIARAHLQGRRFPNLVAQLCWPRHEVVVFLRSGTRLLSMHCDDGILEDSTVARREIFPALDPVIAVALGRAAA